VLAPSIPAATADRVIKRAKLVISNPLESDVGEPERVSDHHHRPPRAWRAKTADVGDRT
jgi:hypothetical protein